MCNLAKNAVSSELPQSKSEPYIYMQMIQVHAKCMLMYTFVYTVQKTVYMYSMSIPYVISTGHSVVHTRL